MHEYSKIKKLHQHTRNIRSTRYNVNILSEHQCLQDYRFKISDISYIASLIDFPEVTTHDEYRCDKMTAIRLSLQRLATTIRWSDVEQEYGLSSSQMSKVFWTIIELFTEDYAGLLDLWGRFLASRSSF